MRSKVSVVVLALVSVLAAAACSSADPTAATVRQIIDELAVQRFGTATARYRADEEMILSQAAAPAWRRGLEHEDSTVREWSIDALARIGEAEDLERVAAALDDPFRRVQEAAARGIIMMDPAAAREAFLSRLASDDTMKQTIAAQGLTDLGEASAAGPLIEQLQNAQVSDGVRGVIALSLATLATPEAIAPLAALAADSSASLRLRRNAAEALATFEEEEATRAMRGLLDSDDTYVRDVARRVIEARR